MNGVLPIDFDGVWEDAIKTQSRGVDMFVMSPEDMLISLCVNSCRKRYFRLKSICDISETIAKFPQISWDIFLKKTHKYECQAIVYAAFRVTQKTVGLEIPDAILNKLKISSMRRAVINTIIHFLMERRSLAEMYPFWGTEILNRVINQNLFLTYATYQPDQIGRKLHETWTSRGR
jgi:hypothetical protein